MQTRMKQSRAYLALAFLLAPFLVGFDIPDSSGTYAKVGMGRGAYHITGCHRSFDSEFLEAQVDMRHTFATGPRDGEPSGWARLRPGHTTLGYFADFEGQTLTLVKRDTSVQDSLGKKKNTRGFAGGAYLGLDWRWIGVQAGWGGYLFNPGVLDAQQSHAFPMAGIRLGDAEGIYATAEVWGSTPFLSGGGQMNFGAGTKLGATRIWLGLGSYSVGGNSTMGVLKVEHGFGPLELHFSALGSAKDVPPAGLGIDNEYGFSLGLSYRLSSLR